VDVHDFGQSAVISVRFIYLARARPAPRVEVWDWVSSHTEARLDRKPSTRGVMRSEWGCGSWEGCHEVLEIAVWFDSWYGGAGVRETLAGS
jgi:hypothetical protein